MIRGRLRKREMPDKRTKTLSPQPLCLDVTCVGSQALWLQVWLLKPRSLFPSLFPRPALCFLPSSSSTKVSLRSLFYLHSLVHFSTQDFVRSSFNHPYSPTAISFASPHYRSTPLGEHAGNERSKLQPHPCRKGTGNRARARARQSNYSLRRCLNPSVSCVRSWAVRRRSSDKITSGDT